MTLRSIILALLASALISAGCYFYDNIIRLGWLVPGQMPTVIYGGLIVLIVLVNPFLGLLRPSWRWSGGELAVFAALGLLACSVPSWGLAQHLVPQLMIPHQQARTDVSVRRTEVLDDIPAVMLADLGNTSDTQLNSYINGMGAGDEHIKVTDVPWHLWGRTLTFWGPMLFAFLAGTLGLAVVIHHQWSRREHLAYPISTFAHSLLPEQGRAVGRVFRCKSFWITAGLVATLGILRYIKSIFPEMVAISDRLDFAQLNQAIPIIPEGGGYLMFEPFLIFMVIGLSYRLPSTVSFTLGVTPFMYFIFAAMLGRYAGIELRAGQPVTGTLETFLYAGGYFGIGLMILYAGRRYYRTVLARSLLIPIGTPPESASVWGMRVFLMGSATFVCMLILIGLPWFAAVGYTLLAVLIFTVVSRVVAEAGVYHIGTELVPGAVLTGFLGASALGIKAIAIMSLVSGAFLMAPGWGAMPFAVQGLKLTELAKVPVARPAKWGLVVLLLGMVIAIPMTIYWQFDSGAPPYWPTWASRFALSHAAGMKSQVADTQAEGILVGAPSLAAFNPDSQRVTAFCLAAALAVGVGLANLRWPWWPLHPVMFIFLGGFQAQWMWLSCLLGWGIKTAVVRFGGGRTYEAVKPAMAGLIAGDVLGHLVPMIIGSGYWFVTGTRLVAG